MSENNEKERTSVLKEWKLHLTMLVVCTVAAKIGSKVLTITPTLKVTFLPILWAMIMAVILYKLKPIKWVKEKQVKMGGFMINMSCALLMGLLGISVGKNLPAIIAAGVPMLLQNVGDAFTCVIALPIAVVFFGMKREAIGLTFGNSREVLLSASENRWGAESAEFRGTVAMYIVGTIFGTITISLLTSLAASTGILSPEAIAMAGGCGAASMSTAAIGTIQEFYPAEIAEKLTAFCTTSNMISSAVSTYLALFIGMPLAEKLYKVCSARREKKEALKAEQKSEKE